MGNLLDNLKGRLSNRQSHRRRLNRKKIFVCFLILFFSSYMIGHADYSNYRIYNEPTSTLEQCEQWAKDIHANDLFKSWIPLAYDISLEYGIDPTVLIAQTSIETGYARFGGVIDSSYHNTCGMKVVKGGDNYDRKVHQRFTSWEVGFRAQAQHLRLYAGKNDIKGDIIYDPRHFEEIKGTAKNVSQLSSKWASNSSYGNQVNNLCEEIVRTKVKSKDTILREEKNKNYEGHKDKNDNKDNLKNNIPNTFPSKELGRTNRVKNILSNRSKNSFMSRIKNSFNSKDSNSKVNYVKEILNKK